MLLPAGLVCLASCSAPEPETDEATQVLTKACDFLWSMQAPDGGWHSEEHGLMRGGEATTAFVLNALLQAEADCTADDDAKREALGFIRGHVNGDGVLGLSDPDIVDYPNYATAYGLAILARNGDPTDSTMIRVMRDHLVSQQFDQDRGIEPSHPAFGGWGFGETVLPANSVGHVDLSHTRRVLEALRDAGHADPGTYEKAHRFLALHQKRHSDPRVRKQRKAADASDGGFFASSAVPVVNKSNPLSDAGGIYFFTSYATATADGVLALTATGLSPGDERVDAAVAWLKSFSDWAYPSGIPRDSEALWGRVMFYYHIMVRAEAYRALGIDGSWRDEVAILLRDRQRDDGRFRNPYGAPNKEDDPLIATAMVVTALAQP